MTYMNITRFKQNFEKAFGFFKYTPVINPNRKEITMITKPSLNTMLSLGLFALMALMLFFPMDAFAGGVTGVNNDLTDQSRRIGTQIATVPKLIALGSYVIGAFFAVRALFALKGFIESPDDNPLTKVLGFAAVSTLLIMLPYIIGVMQNTLGASSGNVQSSATSFRDSGSF